MKEASHKKGHTVRFHLHDIQGQARLISNDRKEIGGCQSWRGGVTAKGEERTFKDALCLDLGDSRTGAYIRQRLFDLSIKICAFYCM